MAVFDPGVFDPVVFDAGDADPATVARYATMLSELFPPGRVWNFIGTSLASLISGCADELGRLENRVLELIEESDPRTATELLPEFEAELGLEEAATTDERRARIVARLIARQRFRPQDFQSALAPLLGQDAADVVVIERDRAYQIAVGDDKEVYRFFIYRDPGLPGTAFIDSAQELVDQIKPSHTLGYVIESVSFLCDDEFSLCDRDLLGI